MQERIPFDITDCDNGDPDECVPLEIVGEKCADSGNPDFSKKTDQDIEQGIARNLQNLTLPLPDGGAKLKRHLKLLYEEKEFRSKRRKAQTDCGNSKTPNFAVEGDNEDTKIVNHVVADGRLRPSTLSAHNFYGDGEGRKTRMLSDILPGPSCRLGLRSGTKLLRGLSGGQSPFTSSQDGLRPFRGSLQSSSDYCFDESKEFPSSSSALGSKPCRRLRHGQGDGDSPEKVVELSGSDEDEAEIQPNSTNYKVLRKNLASLSNCNPSMQGLRIAYPSREDLEAVEVVYSDLRRLDPLEFLNDTVIDFYIKYMQRPGILTEERKAKFYFFNTFFYAKLSEVVKSQNKKNELDLSKLRKWTKGTNIFEKDYLIIPIHDKWHWSLAIVCNFLLTGEDSRSQRCILHLDSMNPGHKSNFVFRLLRTYLITEWKHQGTENRSQDWKPLTSDDFIVKKPPVPQQENESDCGLFLLHFIEEFIHEAPSAFRMVDLEDKKLFGRDWFHPSVASGLRRRLQDLLQTLFEEEAKRAPAVSGQNKLATASEEINSRPKHSGTAECSELCRRSVDGRPEQMSCLPTKQGSLETNFPVELDDNDSLVEKGKSRESDGINDQEPSNDLDGFLENDKVTTCDLVVDLSNEAEGETNKAEGETNKAEGEANKDEEETLKDEEETLKDEGETLKDEGETQR